MNTSHQWSLETLITLGLIVLGTAILYYGGSSLLKFFITRLIQTRDKKLPTKDIEKRQKTVSQLVVTVWRTIIAVVCVVSIAKVLFPGLDLSPLFASAGIIGVAVAFGSQAIVKDFLTGLFILSENQYRVGDIVSIDNAEGKVEQLGTRTTIVRDFDGNVHYIPNGSITHVTNKTMGYSKVNFSLSLAFTADVEKGTALINKVGAGLAKEKEWAGIITEAPTVRSIDAFSASSVTVTVTGKVLPSDQWNVSSELRRRLIEAFKHANIELAK